MAKEMEKVTAKEKTCNKCGEVKPLKEFAVSKEKVLNVCKQCESERVLSYYKEYGEYYYKSRFRAILRNVKEYEEGMKSDAVTKSVTKSDEGTKSVTKSDAVTKSVTKSDEGTKSVTKSDAVTKSVTKSDEGTKSGAIHDLTYEEFLSVIVADNPENKTCAYCGKTEAAELDEIGAGLSIDHIIPLCYGGYNTLFNITNACRSCNSSKSNKHVLNFYKRSEDFTEERLNALIKHIADTAGKPVGYIRELLEITYRADTELEKRVSEFKENVVNEELPQAQTPQLKVVI